MSTKLVAAAAALLLVVPQAFAERNADVRVRAFAALPDWTGLWRSDIAKLDDNPSGHNIENSDQLGELRASKLLAHPPYNPEWERKYEAMMRNPAGLAALASGKSCQPAGFPMEMDWANVFQVVVTPEETLFVFEDGAVRHVYTDGRSHPPNDELWPTSQGDSIGHWEGETLVVDTVAREAGPVMVGPAAILSERAHFTERLRRIDKNALEDQMTIEDPLRFSGPWHLRLLYGRVTEMNRMVAWNCDNDRNPVVNGKLTIAPP